MENGKFEVYPVETPEGTRFYAEVGIGGYWGTYRYGPFRLFGDAVDRALDVIAQRKRPGDYVSAMRAMDTLPE